MKLEIEKMLVISTWHVSEKDMTFLCEPTPNGYPYTKISTGYGTLIRIPDDMVLPEKAQSIDFIKSRSIPDWCKLFSKEFIEILRLAQDKKCAWVNFDRDGPEVEGLPKFPW